MSKITTPLVLKLSIPIEQIEDQLKERLPKEYDLYKGIMSDSWTIKNKQYKHSFHFSYESENNKVITERIRGYWMNPFTAGFIALIITESLIAFLGIEFEKRWTSYILPIIGFTILYRLYDPILDRINPQRKTKMQAENKKIVAIVESLKSLNPKQP